MSSSPATGAADTADISPAVAGTDKAKQAESVPATPPQPLVAIPASTVASLPHPAVAVALPVSVPVPDDDLPSILRRLTPIQRAKLRSAAISEGVIQSGGGVGSGGRKNADGSLSVTIRVDGDLVPQLDTWAEEAGVPIDVQIREIVGQLLSGYLMGEWTQPQPVAAAPAAAGTK